MMDRNKKILVLSALGLLLVEEERCRRRRIRRNRTKSRMSQRQDPAGALPSMCRELETHEPDDFKNMDRVFPAQFHVLEDLVRPIIQRCNTNYRDCICVGDRLRVTLRFLATGESFKSLSSLFQMGVSTIRQMVPETCDAIYQVLKEKYLKCPDTAHEWQQVSDGFTSQWNFPNCLGALDGKQVNTRPPLGTGSPHPQHTSPMVLMGLVDSSYRFLYAQVGRDGRVSDGGVFRGCSLADALATRTTNIPAPAPLPGSDQLAPYCIAADKAFPLTDFLLKPYANRRPAAEQRVFNYRLSRARRVAENAFGVMANRFRVLRTTISVRDAAKVESIALACCALHNFLRSEGGDAYMADVVDREGPDGDIIEGRWRQDPVLQQAPLPKNNNAAARAKEIRDQRCRYFMSDTGAVPFQWGKM